MFYFKVNKVLRNERSWVRIPTSAPNQKTACALLTKKSAFFIYNFFNLSKQKIGGNYDRIKILELGTRGQKR